jgi:cation diffusion facilitator family transporter
MSDEATSPVDPQKLSLLERKQHGVLNWQFPINNFTVVLEENVSSKKRAVREFYEQQNEKVLQWQHLAVEHHLRDDEGGDDAVPTASDISDVDTVNTSDNIKVPLNPEEDMESNRRGISKYWLVYEQWCINGSFWINVCLFCLKLAGAVTSMSLSVITSALDSFLDLLSGLILYATNRISKKAKKDRYSYPMGKSRLEPLGFIIFASVMATAALQIVRQGAQDIISGFINGEPFIRTNGVPVGGQFLGFGNKTVEKVFFYSAIFVLAFTATVKGTLWQICKRCKHSPAVQAYAFDHRNDLLTNSLLLCGVFMSRWLWWIDALIALILSCYIIYSWIMQSMEHIAKLVGKVAETEFLQKVTYVAMNHHKSVLKVDTVQAWYLGMNMYVEVDIVLPVDMSLKEAHDIGEQLQLKIEKLPDVERCYVHLDYEYEHSKCDEHVPVF